MGESFDFRDGQTGDVGRPFRRAGCKMGFEFRREIGEPGHIVPVGQTITQQHMLGGNRQRAISAGP